MYKKLLLLLINVSMVCYAGADTGMQTETVTSTLTAIDAYEDGFATDLMRADVDGGVMLDNMVLIEDDGPGSGNSEKGTFQEEICRDVMARKTFILNDARAEEAHIVLFMTPKNPDRAKQVPFYIILNGQRFESPALSWHESMWHWIKVPVDVLKSGDNSLVVGCDAPKGEGYALYIARADEYEAGGGMFADSGELLANMGQIEVEIDEQSGKTRLLAIGKNSAKSTDGGKTWQRMKLGETNDVVGEYTLRLNLKRYRPEEALSSPPIDLWDGLAGMTKIKPQCRVTSLRLLAQGETPEGTTITWQVREADTSDMTSAEWGDYATAGNGEAISVKQPAVSRRYMQWRAILRTNNPLVTPVVRSVTITRDLTFTPPEANTYYVWKYDTVKQRYSSVKFAYENWDEPKLAELRERLDLDRVVAGATSDFERINRVRHLVSSQWFHGSPLPDYPEWDALEILDRRDSTGTGGMCIQFSLVFIQSLLSLGYQARHINMFAHETVEVYVDELGKWVHVDPESVFDSYEYNSDTGMPINCLEQHRFFLKENNFSAARPIDWQATEPWAWPSSNVTRIPQPLSFSTETGWINDPSRPTYPPQHTLAGFMRMMPRNDYFSRPYPRPLTQGCSNWPWTGYLNWYDEATPRKLQYPNHTDRAIDFYPTLNRVEFSAVYGEKAGDIDIDMITFAPNFDGFEINIDDQGWTDSPSSFVWALNRGGLNTLAMRVKNKLGPKGKPSVIQVMYNNKVPYAPKPEH